MFVGHYAPAFLAKRLHPAIPLWGLFLAGQLVDVLWTVFLLSGIEHVRIVPGFTRTNPLDLYYMPYTHSLPGALAWAAAAAVLYRSIGGSGRAAVAVGAVVFSHWPLDLVVHRPDLPLYDNTAKVGFGLWDRPYLTLVLEGILFLGAMGLYLQQSRPVTRSARYSIVVFGIAVFLMQAGTLFSPPPPSPRAIAITGLGTYAILAALIGWLERGRAPRRKVVAG